MFGLWVDYTPRCFAGDVRKTDDCDAAVKLAVDTYGALDILVNAAAGADIFRKGTQPMANLLNFWGFHIYYLEIQDT